MYKNVSWFQIAVNDSKFVHFLEPLSNLLENIQGSFFVDFACRAITLEISTGTILHDEVDVIGSGDDLIEFNYIGVLQLLHDIDLIVQRLFKVPIRDD